ncbi:MAG: hypothetical protein ACLPLR_18615 [Terriglobales bacterium]
MGARGGKRPGAGRKKKERLVDANVARKIKARIHAEDTWVDLIETEKYRLRLHLPVKQRSAEVSTVPLANMLRYLDDRDLGRPVDTVNHLHDKPIEMNATLSIRGTLEKALQRALAR